MTVFGEYETELVDSYGDPQHETDDGAAGFRSSWTGVPRSPKIFSISLAVAEADGDYVLAANFDFNIEGCGGSVLEP